MGNILGRNWLTTIIGLVAAVTNALLPILQTGSVDDQTLVTSAFMAALGWAAKSFNVSGTNQDTKKDQ